MGEESQQTAAGFRARLRFFATKSIGLAKRFWLTLPVLIKVVAAASLTFGLVAWAIVEYAPSIYGPAAALRDWQTFLAGIVGFAGLIVGAFLNAAETRARDDRIRNEERQGLAAALIGEIGQLAFYYCTLATLLDARNAGGMPERYEGDLTAEPLLAREAADKLGLLRDVGLIQGIFDFYGRVRFFRARDGDPVGPVRMNAGIALRVATSGLKCIEGLAPIAGLSRADRDSVQKTIGLHRLPEKTIDELLKSGGGGGKAMPIIARLRAQEQAAMAKEAVAVQLPPANPPPHPDPHRR